MKALAIDTSNYTLGVAVIDNSTIIGEYITNIKKNHSVRAMPAIQSLLRDVDMVPSDLDRIIVAKGPGSYTGVRIGVTIAKTLAWSLNIPVVGISSLEVLANNGKFFNGLVCPIFDARRGQVYTALYKEKDLNLIKIMEDTNILLKDWLELLKKEKSPILFIGNDVSLHHDLIIDTLGDQAKIASVSAQNARPSELAILGIQKEPDEVHHFVPNYIRLAEAEAKWLASKKQ